MRIAQIAPIVERVPPKTYGGTERVVAALTNRLVGMGHEVTLFASGDSETRAKLVSVVPEGTRALKVQDLYGPNQWSLLHFGTAYSHQEEFDIIHDHNTYLSLPIANMAKTPVLMTLHGAITPLNKHLFETLRNPYLATISHAQTQAMSNLNILGTVHNGLEMAHYPFSNRHDGYLLFVGRFSMEKGAHLAIDIAQQLNMPLVIAAKLDDIDKAYFNEFVRPRLNSPLIRWVGEVNEEKRNDLMKKAYCLLHPANWREPFGLTLIEAMATGCPVIAFNRGSISEIIEDGETGFTVDTSWEMAQKVKDIPKISRQACRTHSLHHFNAQRMALGYEALYYHLLNHRMVEKRQRQYDLDHIFSRGEGGAFHVTAHDVKKTKKK